MELCHIVTGHCFIGLGAFANIHLKGSLKRFETLNNYVRDIDGCSYYVVILLVSPVGRGWEHMVKCSSTTMVIHAINTISTGLVSRKACTKRNHQIMGRQ